MKLSQRLIKEKTDPFFNQWTILKEVIENSHRLRDSKGQNAMADGIILYKNLLQQCNGQITPLNGQERLMFIEQRPSNYAAFRQLDELFAEMKKLIASKRVQLKRLEE
ncbi:YpoC family protein [Planococcus sp. 1R117A]|uniref:YpoC family protein n=1 Tax=Planococcus sp. 1R117A TaxID=3447020 RepID=UPI003EDC48FD